MHIIFLMRNCNITFEINFYYDIDVNIVQQTTQGFREEYYNQWDVDELYLWILFLSYIVNHVL